MTNAKMLCLNMIVRNETANLERCLGAVADHIACWVIGDTGSTDGTPDFIRKFFAQRGIPGELHSFPFQNFEQARNAALDCAYASTLDYDYLLLADADMELVVEDPDFRTKLEGPCYDLLQRTGNSYWNARIVRRDAGARYRGVTHEYIAVPGGGQHLCGVWFKDHASGSNRVDKFVRDIKLLLEALKLEPENHRYWFYLAQSYKDAGQTAEAVEAYAKRAAMGGWDEEAWYARLQQARCLRQLGNEGGFLREALAAFNQRPRRAEPVYELAQFYREKGMNDASVLFAETGLALLPPDEDILFVEDFIYTAGLKEEYSIAANYSRDPARRDRGFAACNWLALRREVPQRCRDLARWNLFFYLRPANAIMPSFTARPVGFTPPDGYRSSNPSVTRLGNELVLLQRAVNFTLSEDGGAHRAPPAHTRNFLLRLGADLAIRSSTEIHPPAATAGPASHEVQEFEDAWLFARRDKLWCIASVREPTPESWCDQVLVRIDDSSPGSCRFTDWRVLRQEGPRRHEQGWMPQVTVAPAEGGSDQFHFIASCDPTRVVDEHGRTFAETTPTIAAEQFRGSTQAIVFDGGWLALVHELSERDKQRYYQHRFVWFDSANRLRRVSRPFYFIKHGVELASGLAWHLDGKRLIISFGAGDHEAWIATIETGDIQALLEGAKRLPWGAPSNEAASTGSPVTTTVTPAVIAPGTTIAEGPRPTQAMNKEVPEVHPKKVAAPPPWSRKLRFHILGIPHTASNKNYVACAYTQQVVKLCRMLKERGHTVIHYGNEASDVVCDEHVTVTTQDDLIKAYGFEEWKRNMFRFDHNDHAYQTFYRNTINELGTRKAKNDFLLCMWGNGHKPVADAHSDLIAVESGIAYPYGHFARFRVFVSYALFHALHGVESVARANLNAFYVVIPSFFDVDEFEFSAEKDDYFLYLGRIMWGKGVHIALQVASHINAKIIVAGQGSLADVGYKTVPDNIEFVGFADLEKRKKLMSRAKGLFLPSQYIEPFGFVTIESLLSGTPTITSDWGVFAENNLHGITGYRCRTFDHFVWAAQNIGRIDPHVCRRWAAENFSVERIGEMYEEFFQSVMDLHAGKGWYEVHPARAQLNWLAKQYPGVGESTGVIGGNCNGSRAGETPDITANRIAGDVDSPPHSSDFGAKNDVIRFHGDWGSRFRGEGQIRFYGEGERRFAASLQAFCDHVARSGHRRTELCQIMNEEGSDKGKGWHNYTLLYDFIFADRRNDIRNVFELGIGTNFTDVPSSMGAAGIPGASLRGWRRYFPNADIFGADVDKRILFCEPRISTSYVDQQNVGSIRDLWSNFPDILFDIIIDDGLHTFEANSVFLNNSYDRLANDGVYVIEDISTEEDNLAKYDVLFRQIGLHGFLFQSPNQFYPNDNCIAFFQRPRPQIAKHYPHRQSTAEIHPASQQNPNISVAGKDAGVPQIESQIGRERREMFLATKVSQAERLNGLTAKRILFYCKTKWAFSAIHSSLCAHLRAAGWTAEIKDWQYGYVISEFAEEVARYDYIVTPNPRPLVDSYRIPHDKIIFVAHDESDVHKLIAAKGVDEFDRYAAYGVISDTLACSSIAVGVKRLPFVVRYGVEVDKYRRPISAGLSSVGYATVMLRKTESGVERKRGPLAQACAEAAGLRFLAVDDRPFESMPEFYGSIDSLLMPSLQEGAGLPPLEAAAAGRLVIGTPAGHFPRLAYEGLGILAPLDAGAFQRFTIEKLIYYRDNPAAYVEKCAAIQDAARQRDWRHTITDWIELFSNPR